MAHARLTREKLSVDIPNRTVAEFIRMILEHYDIRAVVPAELEEHTISVKMANADWSSLLDTALLPCGYDWFVEDGMVWIVDVEAEEEPIYTDFMARLLFAKVEDVAPILRLFPSRDDKESMEVLPKWNQVRFHVRKERLSSLKIFLQNVDEDKGSNQQAHPSNDS